MKNIRPTDEQIIQAWWNSHAKNGYRGASPTEIARELGTSQQLVSYRVLRLRAEGVELPPALSRGHFLTSDRAREIAKLAVRRAAKWTAKRRKAVSDAMKQRNTGAQRPDGRADGMQE